MKKLCLLTLSLLAISPGAWAATPPVTGGALTPITPTAPAAPPAEVAPRVDLQRSPVAPASEPQGLKLVVKSLRITGSQAFSEAQLMGVTGFEQGIALTFAELRAMAQRIASFYQQNGFLVAQAYLPAQDINDGAVVIAVTEGRYGQILVRNQTSLASSVATGLLDGLNPGDYVTSQALETHLLLLSDLPGVVVKSTLVPGATYGTSDLQVDLLPGRRVSGSVDADNAGNRYTGALRVGATVNLNEPLGQGDVASVRLLTSGKGLNYVRWSYQLQVGKARVGTAYSSLDYALGHEFDSLLANGTARIASFYGSYPLVRSRNNNLYAGLTYDSKRFQDRTDSTASVTDKKAHVLTASLNGDHRDTMGGGGMNSYALSLSTGDITIETPAVRAFDAITAQNNGHFNKLGFSAMRLQAVTQAVSLFASVSGQMASKNLDISEKMELGGMYGVRAYPEGEAYADQGYLLSVEARMQLPKLAPRATGQLQLIGFIDSGTVTLNRKPWTLDPNRRTLRGAGVGLNWTQANDFVVRMYYARKLGDESAKSAPDASGRFWIQAVKYF